ncbi:MAG: hypothetical protein NVS1B13_00210 [Flavisolibacter sp.]
MRKTLPYLILLALPLLTKAQKFKKEDRAIIAHLQNHIRLLASDQMEGRLSGSEGEKKSANYIREQFKNFGLEPKGTTDYFQYFDINEGKQVNQGNFLSINGNKIKLNQDYYPLFASPNSDIQSSTSLALKEAGTPWCFDIKDLNDTNNGDQTMDQLIAAKAKDALSKGATALVLYTSASNVEKYTFNTRNPGETLALPDVFILPNEAKKYLNDPSAMLDINLRTDISDKKRKAVNVIGYIDKRAPLTVVIGAHFDHLGHGEDGNSRELEKRGAIHYGADDNASGTAALIELAHLIKESGLKNYNYLFIAFSAEELGLLGSKYFTQYPTIDLKKINYMINMDMVGRLNDSSRSVLVGGYGTSPSWSSLYNQKGKHHLYADNLVFHFDSSGVGPSDHTSFYLKNIPVLYYFTGLHQDYHKPSDGMEKINYAGEEQLIKHIYSLVSLEDKEKNRMAFTPTRQKTPLSSPRFTVTLGIMPDYAFNGTGIRVDAIIDNRPAQIAGLKAGDIITALGPFTVSSLDLYMKALGQFKKGDKTTVVYIRNNQIQSIHVEF